jgi:hypothetical protein
MALIVPKFTWNDGSPHTLTPIFPHEQKVPVDARDRQGTQDFSTDGIGQWMTDRVDLIRTLQFNNVKGSELASWAAFIDWAIEKNIFQFYPDAASGTNFTCTLEDDKWDPKFANKSSDGGYFKFTLTLRMYVTP